MDVYRLNIFLIVCFVVFNNKIAEVIVGNIVPADSSSYVCNSNRIDIFNLFRTAVVDNVKVYKVIAYIACIVVSNSLEFDFLVLIRSSIKAVVY